MSAPPVLCFDHLQKELREEQTFLLPFCERGDRGSWGDWFEMLWWPSRPGKQGFWHDMVVCTRRTPFAFCCWILYKSNLENSNHSEMQNVTFIGIIEEISSMESEVCARATQAAGFGRGRWQMWRGLEDQREGYGAADGRECQQNACPGGAGASWRVPAVSLICRHWAGTGMSRTEGGCLLGLFYFWEAEEVSWYKILQRDLSVGSNNCCRRKKVIPPSSFFSSFLNIFLEG